MGMVRVALDGGSYGALDAAMADRGYATVLSVTLDGSEERSFTLPPGSYWREEPTDERQMRDDARAAVDALGELGAQIVATAGPTAWAGLVPADWPS